MVERLRCSTLMLDVRGSNPGGTRSLLGGKPLSPSKEWVPISVIQGRFIMAADLSPSFCLLYRPAGSGPGLQHDAGRGLRARHGGGHRAGRGDHFRVSGRDGHAAELVFVSIYTCT